MPESEPFRETWMPAQEAGIQPEWCRSLPFQQQSVLMLAARGPDGIAKAHPCKPIQRAYRATVLCAAERKRVLYWGETGDGFMCLADVRLPARWWERVNGFFHYVDSLPLHFVMHLLHGAEILGYKHPDERFRTLWCDFYFRGCDELHLPPETSVEMDARLNDVFS